MLYGLQYKSTSHILFYASTWLTSVQKEMSVLVLQYKNKSLNVSIKHFETYRLAQIWQQKCKPTSSFGHNFTFTSHRMSCLANAPGKESLCMRDPSLTIIQIHIHKNPALTLFRRDTSLYSCHTLCCRCIENLLGVTTDFSLLNVISKYDLSIWVSKLHFEIFSPVKTWLFKKPK